MQYRVVKLQERILYIPDEELKRALQRKRRVIRKTYLLRSGISIFLRKEGLRRFLSRHIDQGQRFFIVIDFIHAFHQITREMIGEVFPKILESSFDNCFVEMSGENIIPIGFPTSNYIFELFMVRSIDKVLKEWAENHKGVVTRNCDNILVTWQKNIEEAFQELVQIFQGFDVRFTPPKA